VFVLCVSPLGKFLEYPTNQPSNHPTTKSSRIHPALRAQAYISDKLGYNAPADGKPVKFVFHGGSGSDVRDIQEAISYGVIKMNIDTDTQWSYWEGIKNYGVKHYDYLQGQIGNPGGVDKPNKKYYDVSCWNAMRPS